MSAGKNTPDTGSENNINRPSNFIKNIIDEDIKNGKNDARVHTRFLRNPMATCISGTRNPSV